MILALIVVGGVATAASVEPETIGLFTGGAAIEQCNREGVGEYEFACKIDGWNGSDENGWHDCPLKELEDKGENSIYIDSDGTYFDWSAEKAIGAVIVKGGPGANVFRYDPQALSDTGLFSPDNPSGNPAEVSHATFCWNPQSDCYYEDETGWSEGERYNKRGNWAMYTEYENGRSTEKEVLLMAGQTMTAGTVRFQPHFGGYIKISIDLDEGWLFADSGQNVKIQGYVDAPSGNPAPGRFDQKFTASGDSWSKLVRSEKGEDKYNYYGVHVDLLHEVCP